MEEAVAPGKAHFIGTLGKRISEVRFDGVIRCFRREPRFIERT